MLKLPLLVTWLALPVLLLAQDPFFTHFYGNEALFNPALVGNRGALSINFKAKHQWHSAATPGYRTYLATLEESMPCSFFDYGLSLLQDQEGSGYLKTQQFGGMLAAPLRLPEFRPFSGDIFQLRLGIGLLWGQQSIDYSRLLFIDQLDPKYGLVDADGLPIPSAFAPPNDGRSNWYFKPSGGAVLQYVANPTSRKAFYLNIGAAIHNLIPLGGDQGQSWSLLGIGTATVPRYTFFANGEWVLGYLDHEYISFRPQIFVQQQRGLSYWESGGTLSFSKMVSAGFYYHGSRTFADQPSTNWGSAQLEVGFFSGENSRIDLGFGYAFNFSGLRNEVANVYELTLRFSFATSPMCRLGGQPADYDKKRSLPCPTLREAARSKIYENIWYNH